MIYHPDDSPAFDMPEFNPEPPDEEPDADVYDIHDPKGPKYHSIHADIYDLREKVRHLLSTRTKIGG